MKLPLFARLAASMRPLSVVGGFFLSVLLAVLPAAEIPASKGFLLVANKASQTLSVA